MTENRTMWDRDDWNREGEDVEFKYKKSIPCSGKISSSRVLYGGNVQHTVMLDSPVQIHGYSRNIVCVQETDLLEQGAV